MIVGVCLLLPLLGHFGTQVWLNHVRSMRVFQGGVQLVVHQLCYVVCSDIGAKNEKFWYGAEVRWEIPFSQRNISKLLTGKIYTIVCNHSVG